MTASAPKAPTQFIANELPIYDYKKLSCLFNLSSWKI